MVDAIAARADAVRRGEGLSVLAEMDAKEDAARSAYASCIAAAIAESLAKARVATLDGGGDFDCVICGLGRSRKVASLEHMIPRRLTFGLMALRITC